MEVSSGVIGRKVVSEEDQDKVLGVTRFITDIRVKDALAAKALRSDQPHALIKNLDVTEAEKVPGVAAVLTARDIPGQNICGEFLPDRPVLAGDKVRSVSDCLALVVGETPAAVEEALARIKVEYQVLPAVFDPRAALAGDAPLIHDSGNLLKRYRMRKGDVEAAFRNCAVIVEGEYHSPCTDGCPLETEAALARIDERGLLEIYAATQIPQYDLNQITVALGLPREKINLIVPPLGGGFGSKCEINGQILAGLAALKTGRPVSIHWDREESFRGHQKRHPAWYKVKTGAAADGRLLAIQEEIYLDGGAYCSWSMGVARNATVFSTGPYEVPNVHIDTWCVYTNNVHSGAQRGFGAPQAALAMELQLDKISEKLGLDPAEIRRLNAMKPGTTLANQDLMLSPPAFRETLEKALDLANWKETRREIDEYNRRAGGTRRRGIGLAAAFKNAGRLGDQAEALVEAGLDQVTIYINSTDIGQGVRSLLTRIAGQVLTVPLAQVRMAPNESACCRPSGDSFSSRQTLCSGNAVYAAAWKLKEKILTLAAERFNLDRNELDLAGGRIVGPGSLSLPLFDFLAQAQDKGQGCLRETGFFQAAPYIEPDPQTGRGACWYAYVFGTQVAVVEVDLETGEVTVRDLIAVHDVGRAINPLAVEGQIEGGVSMGLGYALMEEFIMEDGRIVTENLEKYPIPTALDVPQIRAAYVESEELQGPFGAKGFAECPAAPTAPAIINALHHATGVWINELPATPERVYLALKSRSVGAEPASTRSEP
ncbi:MAG: xanthine dehydrogenase family protein molybdopterin-binding subunit [Thermodesulfobacteriota bacterium]